MENLILIFVFLLGALFGNFLFHFIEHKKGEPIFTPSIKALIGGVVFLGLYILFF